MKTVAVDTGGTFTDMVVLDQETGEIEILKIPSSPADPGQAIVDGVLELFPGPGALGNMGALSHGTTVGTNILVQNKGARVGLLVTDGFAGINDIWHLPHHGHELGNIYIEKTPPVLPRYREGIHERVDSHGNIMQALDKDSAASSIKKLLDRGVESFAVVLLFSFMNAQHERDLNVLIQKYAPDSSVSLSSEILPQIREFPRLSTTVANARLAPDVTAYLQRLDRRLKEQGVTTRQIYIMQSNGGVSKMTSVVPVTTVLSGPCAGALAGVEIASAAGYQNVVTLDMGGTSTDIALGENGRILEQTSGRIGDWELAVPMLMINTIGAGGGTIAWLDKGGSLQVGPHSAGAVPGPVCYGQGGTEPTVTDANVVLGYLNPSELVGGRVHLDRQRAYNAIEELGEKIGMDPLRTAEGILRITNAKMEEGVRAVSTEMGYDLRDFTLVAFGGAGPLPSARLAADLSMKKVIVPPMPGVTSALGLLLADPRRDYVTSRLVALTELRSAELNPLFEDLQDQAVRDFLADGFDRDQVNVQYSLDLRYQGQGYELTVAVGGGSHLTDADITEARKRFDQQHEQLFGHGAPDEPVEVVNYRVTATATVKHATLKTYDRANSGPEAARIGQRQACFDSNQGMVECPVYDRAKLMPGHAFDGPAIVDQLDSTTVVYPSQRAEVDDYRNLIITVS